MRFYTSLHIKTKDFTVIQEIINAWLEPGLDAFIKQDEWIAVYAARLEEQSGLDIKDLAEKLAGFGTVIAFCVHDDIELAIFIFDQGKNIIHSNSPSIFDLDENEIDEQSFINYLKIDQKAFSDLMAVRSATMKVISLSNILKINPQNATQGFDELLEMEEKGELSDDFILLEGPEAEKPGLAEYFGRSLDE